MKALILGFIVIVVAVLTILPVGFGLGWGKDVLVFLRGALPVIAVLIGLILIFAGISDIKERMDSKKENADNP